MPLETGEEFIEIGKSGHYVKTSAGCGTHYFDGTMIVPKKIKKEGYNDEPLSERAAGAYLGAAKGIH